MSPEDPPIPPDKDKFVSRPMASVGTPLAARLGFEIRKPKDWQAFQRNCVYLYRAELKDPNAKEYGKVGQAQRGIDILGRRDISPDHWVGIQCKHIAKPLKFADIMSECRSALTLSVKLKEIIFATTAEQSTKATDAAIAVEKELRAEGHDLKVELYAWDDLCVLICMHDQAYAAFVPESVASREQIDLSIPEGAGQINSILNPRSESTKPALGNLFEVEPAASESNNEDPAIHARIDVYKGQMKKSQHAAAAEAGLLELQKDGSLTGKPWAEFRVETNLGLIAINAGRREEGAQLLENSYQMRPSDPAAKSNLAMARLIQGRFEDAMELAKEAFVSEKVGKPAVVTMLQAAARSTWKGDPVSLIPENLRASEEAAIALAEFYRWRAEAGWPEKSMDLAAKFPANESLRRIAALAALNLLAESNDVVPGSKSPFTPFELNKHADTLLSVANELLDTDNSDKKDTAAYVNNASALLRFAGRLTECESLLRRAVAKLPDDPDLVRLLALVDIARGRRQEAILALRKTGDTDESKLFLAELLAPTEPDNALSLLRKIDFSDLADNQKPMFLSLLGEIAISARDDQLLKESIDGLRNLEGWDISGELLQIRFERSNGLSDGELEQRLLILSKKLDVRTGVRDRYFLAEQMLEAGLGTEASVLLENHLDFQRPGAAVTLYLRCLASARLDEKFKRTLSVCSKEIRDAPEILWISAVHNWNIGSLTAAHDVIDKLIDLNPNDLSTRLFRVELFLRQNDSGRALAELSKPIENLPAKSLVDKFRIIKLLYHFGFVERAAKLAYTMFLEHKANSDAWMTFSALVLDQGRDGSKSLWDVSTVEANVAVDLELDDGSSIFFVVEPDDELRQLDESAWEIDHDIVNSVMGKKQDERVVLPDGKMATIINLRHKYIARLHYVIKNYESRFPRGDGFRSLPLDFESPGGLDQFMNVLKVRSDWVHEHIERYKSSMLPLEVLAKKLGAGVPEAVATLASMGEWIKVSTGTAIEQEAALAAVRANDHRGCVLDYFTFWNCWSQGTLEIISQVCGKIHVPQAVMDEANNRILRIKDNLADGMKSVRLVDEKLAVVEVSPEVVSEMLTDAQFAAAWLAGNATICPAIAADHLPAVIRDHIRLLDTVMFGALVVSAEKNLMLISDDLTTRVFHNELIKTGSSWSMSALSVATDEALIDIRRYVKVLSQQLQAKFYFLGVNSYVLTTALDMDLEESGDIGEYFNALTLSVGGREADKTSHIFLCLEFLGTLWRSDRSSDVKARATSRMLEQIIHGRTDHLDILKRLLRATRGYPILSEFIKAWAVGHFIKID